MESKENTSKRVQRSYTINEKLRAIKRVKEHSGNLSVASRELEIDRKQLREWCRQESDLTNQSDKNRRRAIGGGRGPKFRNLEIKLFQWIVAQRANNMIINYRRLREHTFVLIKELEIEMTDFKCSDKWIFNFMKRNRLTVRKITHVGQADNKTVGEKAQIASDYLNSIPVLTADMDSDQIYNMDETPVYVDMLSSTTIDFVGNKNVDASHCGATKTRFTAVLCVSAAGKVLKTMIILKGLKNVPKIKVPKNIYLTVSNGGSITHELMRLWTDKVFGQRSSQLFHVQNSVLFMDEFSVHKKAEVLEIFKRRNTMVKLIPPKTTSYLQPLDVSIIGQFKKTLRAEWENWFANGKKEYTNKGYRKKPSYQEIVNFVARAVATLNKETIQRAFQCCGIAPRGQTVERKLLNSRLQDVLNGIEVNASDGRDEIDEEDEIQVTEIASDVNHELTTEEEICGI